MKGQYLDYLHLRFDLIKARSFAKCPESTLLDPSWLPILALRMVDEYYEDGPIPIVVTLVFNNQKTQIVIDGIEVATKSVKSSVAIPSVVLSFLNSVNILTAQTSVKRRIKNQAIRLGIT